MLLDVGKHDEPQAFLLAIMQCSEANIRLRVATAKVLLRYVQVGKREQAADAATKAAAGRYALGRPPLKAVR